MNYKAKLKMGEEVLLQNDGAQTRIQLQSGNSAGHESQGTSFETGKWSKAPSLLATKEGVLLQLETDNGPVFVALGKNAIDRLDAAPDLEGAEKIELQETEDAPSSIKMKPMAPMKPMEPMKPL